MGVDIYIWQKLSDSRIGIAQPIMFKAISEGELSEKALNISNESAQQLMDELWLCGYRPTEGTGSAGALAATQKHLEDMKKISNGALKKLGINCK